MGLRMHPSLTGLSERILELALSALRRANTDAVYFDYGMDHRESLAPLSAAHAGELLIKAIICKEHPLLIFKNLFDKSTSNDINLDWLLLNGQTHDFSRLPSLLWACIGENIPDRNSFDEIRVLRNQIQHFTMPNNRNLRLTSLKFIYSNIDHLLKQHFGLYAYNYHEDEFDYYIVQCLVSNDIRFSISPNVSLTEIRLIDSLGVWSHSQVARFFVE